MQKRFINPRWAQTQPKTQFNFGLKELEVERMRLLRERERMEKEREEREKLLQPEEPNEEEAMMAMMGFSGFESTQDRIIKPRLH